VYVYFAILFPKVLLTNSMIVNNYVVNSFLLVLILNILNFDTHDNNCIPRFFPINCDYDFYFCKLKIKKGSFYCLNFHLHHWILGIIGLLFLTLFKDSIIKNILDGMLIAVIVDGLLFSDRFVL
jgi:hypothetical protein